MDKGTGDTWKSQECTFTSQNKKSKLEIFFVAKNWTKVPLLPAQVSPIFLYSSLMKSIRRGARQVFLQRWMPKDLLPISAFILLRLYLVQTRDLELLRRKKKWLLFSNMSFQSLKSCYAFEAILSPREYKISRGCPLTGMVCGGESTTHCNPTD